MWNFPTLFSAVSLSAGISDEEKSFKKSDGLRRNSHDNVKSTEKFERYSSTYCLPTSPEIDCSSLLPSRGKTFKKLQNKINSPFSTSPTWFAHGFLLKDFSVLCTHGVSVVGLFLRRHLRGHSLAFLSHKKTPSSLASPSRLNTPRNSNQL